MRRLVLRHVSSMTVWSVATAIATLAGLVLTTGTARADNLALSFSPATAVLGDAGSMTITVTAENIPGSNPDTVQINIVHDPAVVTVTAPACAGVYGGGSVSGVMRVGDSSVFVCSKVGGPSGPDGAVVTFTLTRVSEANPELTFGMGGPFGTTFISDGAAVPVDSLGTLQVVAPGTVTGTITLQGVSSSDAFAGIDRGVRLDPVGGGDAIGPVEFGVDGSFILDGVAPGTYNVTAYAEGFLDRVLTDVEVGSGSLALPTTELRGGLVDGDQYVSGFDVSIITAAFGLGAGELTGRKDGFGRVVDMNGDQSVSAFDISVVISNFGSESPQPW